MRQMNGTSDVKPVTPMRRKRRLLVAWRYAVVLLNEFRGTLAVWSAAILFGAVLYAVTPQPELENHRPDLPTSLYASWMAMLAQPPYSPPHAWYLLLLDAVYPVMGFILVGEGIVRLALLMVSRRGHEQDWMKVMASTYRDHIVLCGLGHLGYRVLEQLVTSRVDVVAIEKDADNRFLAQAKALKIPILLRDMKEDQALIDAGIERASVIIVATNDDMANLEVALDARRMNPKIRIILRLFDQQIAAKIAAAMTVDTAFSSAALAAPIVAAMSLQAHVLSSNVIAGIPHVTTELAVSAGSALSGKRIGDLEVGYAMRVLALTPRAGPTQSPTDAGHGRRREATCWCCTRGPPS